MSSRRELLLSGVKTALERIQGAPNYTYDLVAEQVQRYIHVYDGDEEKANEFRHFPTIIVRPLNEGVAMESVGLWTKRITIDIAGYLGASASDEDSNALLADLERALFYTWDGFGVGASLVEHENMLVDQESGAPLDGIHVQLTLTYQTDFGDPASGE